MKLFNKSYIEKKIKELPNEFLTFLLDAAISANIKSIAIVGGVVRDLIMKSKYKDYEIIFNDLDLVIEGDAIVYIKELKKIIGADKVRVIRSNKKYQTAEIIINGTRVDIASARNEAYPIPAKNPIVESSTIKNDLNRRDFNINAMAIELKENKIIDLFYGLDAIDNKTLDFLHKSSVLDDPTRIIRAARYSAKLGFNLSNKGLKQIESTIISWPWDWHIGDNPDLAPPALSTRLKMELELLFKSKDWQTALNNLNKFGGLKIIDSKLHNKDTLVNNIIIAKDSHIDPLTALVYMAENPIYLSKRLQLSQQQKEIIEGACKLNQFLKDLTSNQSFKKWSPSKWTTTLEELNVNESSFILEICQKNPLKEYLLSWLYNWKNITSPVNGDDLIAKGWKSGPELGMEIKRQRLKLIDELKLKKYKTID